MNRLATRFTTRTAFLPSLVLLLGACVTVPPIETPSGKPECTVHGASVDEIQAELLTEFMANGWMLQQQTPNQLVFWRETDNVMANALLGSQYDPTTTTECRLVFSESAAGTRVFGQVAVVANEGSAFERRTDMTSSQAGYDLWQLLERMEKKLRGTEASADDNGDPETEASPEPESGTSE